MRHQPTRGERVAYEAWRRGDTRMRCEKEGHIQCEHCRGCACWSGPDLHWSEYPNGVFKVTRDNAGRSLCRECRYQSDVLGNF